MNTKAHVVTIPIEDYQELVNHMTGPNHQFEVLKQQLLTELKEARQNKHYIKRSFIDELIEIIKKH